MTRTTQFALVASLCLGLLGPVYAQMEAAQPHAGGGRMDPARVEKMINKRSEELRARLKLTPGQEPAFATFIAALKPGPEMLAARPDPAELARLPTPERIDRMHAARRQRMADMNAAMDRREEATKAFYATLSPEQKKTFDDAHAAMLQRMGEHQHQ